MTKKTQVTANTGPQSAPEIDALRRLNKPDFVRDGVANQTIQRVPGVIPETDRKALIDSLPNQLKANMKAEFVDAVLHEAETFLELRPNQSGQSYVKQLEDVEQKARALLAALARLGPDVVGVFENHGFDLADVADDPKTERISPFTRTLFGRSLALPPGFALAEIWDVVQDVENIAHMARGQIHPKKGKRPDDFLSKAIAYVAARHFKDVFSMSPPLSSWGWFSTWLSDLGEKLGHPFGAKQAANALAQWGADQSPEG